MTTRAQEDLSQAELESVLEEIREHDGRRREARAKDMPDPGSFPMPEWVGRRTDPDYTELPKSTLAAFKQYKEGLKKQLADAKKALVPLADEYAKGSITQAKFKEGIKKLQTSNDASHQKNVEVLFGKLKEEGKLHPDSRKQIAEAANAVSDFETGLWEELITLTGKTDAKDLAKKIGPWFDGKTKDTTDWFKKVFGI